MKIFIGGVALLIILYFLSGPARKDYWRCIDAGGVQIKSIGCVDPKKIRPDGYKP